MDKAFGVGGSRTHVISLCNSSDSAKHYHFSVSREPGNDLNTDGGLFANLSVAKYRPEALPVRLESTIPYSATVSSKAGGWLETFVLYLPGYRASVDGKPAPVVESDESLNKILVPPGTTMFNSGSWARRTSFRGCPSNIPRGVILREACKPSVHLGPHPTTVRCP